MKITYLDFEQPIAELEAKIESLRASHDDHDNLDISKELEALEMKNQKLSENIYGNLTARPTTLTSARRRATGIQNRA